MESASSDEVVHKTSEDSYEQDSLHNLDDSKPSSTKSDPFLAFEEFYTLDENNAKLFEF